MIRIVIDATALISALLFDGDPRRIIDYSLTGKIQLFISEPLLEEVREVLGGRRFKFDKKIMQIIINELLALAEIVYPRVKIDSIRSDPEDNRVLECALAANADAIVAGDIHLLKLRKLGGIPIHSASDLNIL